MGILSEMGAESAIQFSCNKIITKIEKYPESGRALRELGIELLDSLPNIPSWASKYYYSFRIK